MHLTGMSRSFPVHSPELGLWSRLPGVKELVGVKVLVKFMTCIKVLGTGTRDSRDTRQYVQDKNAHVHILADECVECVPHIHSCNVNVDN